MTFEELAEKLPNGFHDSKIREIKVDFVARSVSVCMDLLVGLPHTSTPEGYRAGTLKLEPTYLFFIEPPDPAYDFIPNGSPLSASGNSVKVGGDTKIDSLLSVLPANAAVYLFFLDNWNSYLYLAGGEVVFSWDDGAVLDAC